ncbi:uncharacterized protein LOC118565418 [Fundulus heteroclitus]|uniref:uncharacterized protein LOC118565418 n=1 Tax=Fundulus heteroclitus TaxID=8078 RepID=UPI00165C9EB9|nr:uncharacterized protein LOC118565418 [Fundulus heteroclitus]
MFPTSNTVKLNRITLKDVVGLKIGPRKRRTPHKAADESPPKTCKSVLSEPASEEAAASVCGDRDRPSFPLTPAASSEERKKDATRDNAGGRPQESHAAAQRAKRRSDLQSCMAPPDTIDFIQNAHLNPPGPPGSKHCRRRSGGASLFVVYGECQCVPPQPKASGPAPAPPPPAFKGRGGKRAESAAPCTNKHPWVTLCDVAARCAVCRHGCGYVLPDELRAKTMRCFKQGARAGFRIWPSCSGHGERDGERGAEVKSGTEQRKRPGEGAQSEASTSPSKHFCNGWMEADHTPAGPLLSTKREGGAGSAGVDQDPDAGLGSDRLGLELGGDKRTRQEDGVQCSRASSFVDAISKARLPGGPAETNPQQMSADESGEEDTAESFTCQRVKPYCKKRPSSCARTYMPWPFPNGRPRRAAGASAAGLSERSAGSSKRSAGDSLTDSQDLLSWSSGESHSLLSDAFGGKMSASVQVSLKPAELSAQSEGPVGRLPSRPVSFPGPAQRGEEPGAEAGTFPFSRPDTDGSASPAPRSAPSPSDWETSSALSHLSDLSAHDASSWPSSTPCSALPLGRPSGEVQNAEGKPVGLHQDENNNNNNGSPPSLEPFDTSPFKPKRLSPGNVDADSGDFLLPPLLSPVTSPCRRVLDRTAFPTGSDDTEQVLNRDQTPAGSESSRDLPERHDVVAAALSAPSDITAFKPAPSPSDADGGEEENPGRSDSTSEEAPRKAAVGSKVLPEGVPSPSSQDEESLTDEEEHSSATEEGSASDGAEGDDGEAGKAKEESAVLDELTAYEQDILLVGVVQEDPELFENLPEKSVLNLGPVREPPPRKKKAIPRITFSAQAERPSPATEQR